EAAAAEAARVAAEEAAVALALAYVAEEAVVEEEVIQVSPVIRSFRVLRVAAPVVTSTSDEVISSVSETQSTTLPVVVNNMTLYDSTVDNNLQTISKQDITTVTTPMDIVTTTFVRTTETYDNGSVMVTDGDETSTTLVRNDVVTTSSNIESVVGRVDQVEQLIGIDIHRNMDIEQGITVTKTEHKMNNGYSAKSNVYSIGIEDLSSTDNIVTGIEYNEVNTTMTGSDSSGNMKTHAYRVDIGKSLDNNDTKVTASLNHTTSDLSYSRVIGNYAAAGETTTTDNYASIMLEKETGNFRPFVGYTIGQRKTQGYTETGSILAVIDYATEKDTYNYPTVGLNVNYDVFTASIRKDFDEYDTTRIGLDVNKSINDKLNLMVGFNRNISNYDTSNSITAGALWTF
ncbi:autotransporter outer membrane beta-barrel domain-containing protein, partial [bacterium]|nr:autotransporter outer membrane beta-barrel domain-containing protein [bacterium]